MKLVLSILSGVLLYAVYDLYEQRTTLMTQTPLHITAHAGGSIPRDIPDQIVPVRKPEVQWKKTLPPLTYKVMRECATERAFSGQYWEFKGIGAYICAACRLPLFDAQEQYYPGSGWADFHRPIRETRLKRVKDKTQKEENPSILVGCARCNGYLGKMLRDGNSEKNPNRYCINNVSLIFVPKP